MNNQGGLWRVFPDYDSEEMLMKLLSSIGLDPEDDSVPDELHVTLAFDKTNPKVAADTNPGAEFFATVKGATLFGEGSDKILVLELESSDLCAEHDRIHACGAASFSFTPYRPHITLSKQGTDAQAEFLDAIIKYPNRPPISMRLIDEERTFLN